MAGWLDSFTGKAQKGHIQAGIDAANADLGKQTTAINDASKNYQTGFQKYTEGGAQDYATYRNALANGTGDTFDKQYLDPNGAMQQALRQQFKVTNQGSNTGGNFGSGVGTQALTKTLYNNYMPAQQAWLDRQKGMVDLGYGATQASGAGYMQGAGMLSNAYGQNAAMLQKSYGDMAQNDNTGIQNALGVESTVAKFMPGAGGLGGINYGKWGNNIDPMSGK